MWVIWYNVKDNRGAGLRLDLRLDLIWLNGIISRTTDHGLFVLRDVLLALHTDVSPMSLSLLWLSKGLEVGTGRGIHL